MSGRPGPEEIPGLLVEQFLTRSHAPRQSYGQIVFLVSSGSVHYQQHRQSDTSEHWIRPQTKMYISNELS